MPGARRVDVLIAGGGIAGLTFAYELENARVDCLVVEKEPRPGGLARTERHEGFLLDAGPDAFLVTKPHARVLCEEIGLAEEIVPTNPDQRRVYVLWRGRLRALPEGMRLTAPTRLGPLLRSDLFSLRGKLRLALEPAIAAKRNDEEESIAEFVLRRFGPEALERVGEPLLAGIHCGDPKKLSMNRLFPQLLELERRHGSVVRGMRAQGQRQGSMFASLTSGMGRLAGRLAELLRDDTLRLGSEVTSLQKNKEGFVASVSTGESVCAKAVVLALPLPVTARLLDEPLPRASAALGKIPFVSTVVVFLAYRRSDVSHPLDGYGFVVPKGEDSRLLATTFVTTKLPSRAPEGTALLRCFLGGTKAPELCQQDDDGLVSIAREELSRTLGVSATATPLLRRVFRWPRRTPQVQLGHRAVQTDFETAISEWPGLFVVGNGLASVGIPDTVAEARRLAGDVRRFLADS